MPDRQDPIRDLLSRENDEYRQLLEEHQGYEAQLDALNGKVFLSDHEKNETVRLKKEKLRLKDKMAAIARDYLAGHPEAAGR